jgi:hypothetical protein
VKHLLTTVVALCLAATVNAQQNAQPKPQPAPAPATAKPAPQAPPAQVPAPAPVPNPFAEHGEAINIGYEIRIREEGGAQPVVKTVSMTGTLHEVSLIRANQGTNNPLNVDVNPTLIRDAKVHTKLGIEYTPLPTAGPNGGAFRVRQNVSIWLESGKPMVISQSSDPASDRRLIVEVTATIIR